MAATFSIFLLSSALRGCPSLATGVAWCPRGFTEKPREAVLDSHQPQGLRGCSSCPSRRDSLGASLGVWVPGQVRESCLMSDLVPPLPHLSRAYLGDGHMGALG